MMMLLLHFLMVAAALFSLPALDEISHALEDLVSPPKVLHNEMAIVQL
jgi:hypothetical protein